MSNKERLLDIDEPLRFVFSHSALREGWDNPNVFQICTLNETNSVIQKRQEIGRGLRLPVNQEGERIHDPVINRLTVVANESYKTFAATLQKEYEEEAGVRFGKISRTQFNNVPDPAMIDKSSADGSVITIGQSRSTDIFQALHHNGFIDGDGRIQDQYNPNQLGFDEFFAARLPEDFRDSTTVARIQEEINKRVFRDRHVKPSRTTRQLQVNDEVLDDETFIAFWNTIARKTRYLVEFDTDSLIDACVESINNMAKISAPQISVEVAKLEQSHAGIRELNPHYMQWIDGQPAPVLPDIITMIQSETNLTRRTISRILAESKRLDEFALNPQAYITQVTDIVRENLNSCLLDGLRYELLEDNRTWQVREFSRTAVTAIEDKNLFEPSLGKKRSVYDAIPTDSDTEMKFVAHMDEDPNVKYFIKLPAWFKIDTPIGTYNPDWAIMYEDERAFCLVRETKSTTSESARRGTENDKIQSARAHYDAIDVDFDDVTTWGEVVRYVQSK